jgi:hypothetical protein
VAVDRDVGLHEDGVAPAIARWPRHRVISIGHSRLRQCIGRDRPGSVERPLGSVAKVRFPGGVL